MRRKKTKRPATTTISEQQRIVAAAFKTIEPPAHMPLSKEAIPFFNSIIGEFAKAEWTDHMIEIAATMARQMGRLETQERIFQKEKKILHTKTKYPYINPRATVIGKLIDSILTLRRSLQLHTRGGESAVNRERREMNSRQIEQVALEADDEGLIKRPSLN